MSDAERRLREAGHRQVWLAVVAGNARARRFYERSGWTDEGPFAYLADGPDGLITVARIGTSRRSKDSPRAPPWPRIHAAGRPRLEAHVVKAQESPALERPRRPVRYRGRPTGCALQRRHSKSGDSGPITHPPSRISPRSAASLIAKLG